MKKIVMILMMILLMITNDHVVTYKTKWKLYIFFRHNLYMS